LVFPNDTVDFDIFLFLKELEDIFGSDAEAFFNHEKLVLNEIYKLKKNNVKFTGFTMIDGLEYATFQGSVENDKRYYLTNKIPQLIPLKEGKLTKTLSSFDAARQELLDAKKHGDFLEIYRLSQVNNTKSILYVTNAKGYKDKISNFLINDKNLFDFILTYEIDREGAFSQINSGKVKAIPRILIASDFISAQYALEKKDVNITFDQVYVNMDEIDDLTKSKDIIQTLMTSDLPITFLGTYEKWLNHESFFAEIGIDVTPWDFSQHLQTITQGDGPIHAFANKEILIETIPTTIDLYNDHIPALFSIQEEMARLPKPIQEIYEGLIKESLRTMRSLIAQPNPNLIQLWNEKIDKNKNQINSVLFDNLYLSILSLLDLIKYGKNPKLETLLPLLQKFPQAVILTSKSDERDPLIKSLMEEGQILAPEKIIPFDDFLNSQSFTETIIVPYWLKKTLMRKLIFTNRYRRLIFVFSNCEKNWSYYEINNWYKTLRLIQRVAPQMISLSLLPPPSSPVVQPTALPSSQTDSSSDNSFLDRFLMNQQRARMQNYSTNEQEISIEAYPFEFEDGSFAFFSEGHRLMDVTSLFLTETGQAVISEANTVKSGSILVFKTTGSDLITYYANEHLTKNGNLYLREIAKKWSESLLQVFETQGLKLSEIFKKLKENGFERNFFTLRNWVLNHETIMVRNQEDLTIIAKTFGDENLLKSHETVFAAGQEILAAHRLAGRVATQKLKILINQFINSDFRKIDFSKKIVLTIPEVGEIFIKKISAILPMISISPRDLNEIKE